MFKVNEDNSIYATRGDIVFFTVSAEDEASGDPIVFYPGDVLRMKVYGKKDAENVVMQKYFPITEETEEVEIFLTAEDTKFGMVISKPTDYWYEIELNPDTDPQTIIGYTEDGATVFKLFPEGADVEEYIPTEEEIGAVDEELDASSPRPVQNRAIARAIADATYKAESARKALALESARIDNLVTSETVDEELIDIRVDADGNQHSTAGTAVRNSVMNFNRHFGLYRGMLSIDTKNKTASLIRTDGTDGKEQLVTNFNGNSTRSTNRVFDTDTVNLISSAACIVVINTADNSFFCEKGSNYQRASGDVILCGYSDSVVYPFELSASNIMVDGYKLSDQNMRADIDEQLSSYQRAKFVIWNKKLIVDRKERKVTLPACYFSIYPNFARLKEIAEEQSVNWDESMRGALYFVVLTIDGFTLSIQPRTYEFTTSDILMGGLLYDSFIPVQIDLDNVDFVNEIKGAQTMNDLFESLSDATKTTKIVLGGDSIVHGVGGSNWGQTGEKIITADDRTWNRSPNSYCWAKLFKDYIEANYNATVINNGCTGTKSWFWETHKEELIPADTDLFVLMVGTNDRNVVEGATTKAVQLANYETNLRSIVDYCHSVGIKVLLCSPIPASTENEEQTDHAASCFELNGVVQRVCASYSMPFVNMYNEVFFYAMDHGMDYDSLLPDGVHPNDELYRIMFYRFMRATGLAPHYTQV